MNHPGSWHIHRVTSNYWHILFTPRATGYEAVVVFERGNCLGLLGAQTALNKVDCALGAYRFHLIPLGRRTISFDQPVLAAENGASFTVHISLSYRIVDPVTIAEDNPADLDGDVREWVRGLLYRYDGQYASADWPKLRQTLGRDLKQPRLGLGVEVDYCNVRVQSDLEVQEVGPGQLTEPDRPKPIEPGAGPDELHSEGEDVDD